MVPLVLCNLACLSNDTLRSLDKRQISLLPHCLSLGFVFSRPPLRCPPRNRTLLSANYRLTYYVNPVSSGRDKNSGRLSKNSQQPSPWRNKATKNSREDPPQITCKPLTTEPLSVAPAPEALTLLGSTSSPLLFLGSCSLLLLVSCISSSDQPSFS